MPPLTPEDVFQQSNVSRETFERLILYGDLLKKWQKAVNLVSGASLGDLWRRHMLDSLQLIPYIEKEFEGLSRRPVIVDLGSGAGFPGMVLAIAGLGDVHLVESDMKKCSFLREVARRTRTSVTIHESRIESLSPWAADLVTARGLAPLPKLMDLAEPFLGKGSQCLFLKGERGEEELTEARKKWNMHVEQYQSITSSSGIILHLKDVSCR